MTNRRILMIHGTFPLRVVSATDFCSRLQGLAGQTSFLRFDVLRLAPCRAVHTIGIAVPIDLLFVDSEQRVLRIVSGLRPWRLAFCRNAREVWELRSGMVAQLGLACGDVLPW